MRSTIRFVLAGLALGTSVFAHGPQIQITNENGKIVTRELHLDEPYGDALTNPVSVYVMPLLPSGIAPNQQYFSRPNTEESAPGVPAFNSGPGLAFGINSTFDSGYNFRLSFVDGLKLWDGASFVDPGSEQIQAFRGSATSPSASAITSDAGPFAGINFPTLAANYSSDAHNSASFRLLGDGTSPTSASDDGVYLLSLQLSSTQPNLTASDPYYFVLYKNVGLDQALVATRSLGVDASRVQVVPEVGSLAMTVLAVSGIAFGCIRRRLRSC